MKVTNKQKAIKKTNEYLNLLKQLYNRNNKSYLYIYTWIELTAECNILENLNIDRKNGYHERTNWETIINDFKSAVLCEHIDPRIKNDALSILSNNDLMKIFNELLNCFK